MRILVTGSAGFLGSHLCEKLLLEGNEVVGLDNYYTGDKRNYKDFIDHAKFEFIRHDVVNPIQLEVDFIVNLACPASPIHYQKNPVKTLQTSVLGMTNMLNLAKNLGIGIFQASTSEVYGDPMVSPQHETYLGNVNPIGIRACYDEGKRVAETLMFDYYRQFGTEIKIARIFNTYGPRMQIDDGRVVTNFIVQALRGENITIYGNGSQTRSFCYVTDLISGIVGIINSSKEITGPINLGNPVEFTMLELANLVIQLTGSKSKIDFLELPADDPKQRKPDIAKAKEILNWEPEVILQDGLKLTIEDLDSRI
jgi:UDP-glucuronate decarboxylase